MKLRMLWWLVAGLLVSAPALADVKIGYVDVRAVLLNSKAGIQFRADMEKLQHDKESAINKEQDKLKAMQQALAKDALTLTDSQKQEKQKALEEKYQDMQKMVADARGEMDRKGQEYQSRSIEQIKRIITDVAKQEKVNLVLGMGEVLYADDGMDLTTKVTEKFDAVATKGGAKTGDKASDKAGKK